MDRQLPGVLGRPGLRHCSGFEGECLCRRERLSGDFPVTFKASETVDKEATGSFENQGNGSSVFVSKLNPLGSALVYSTYLGGTGQNFGEGQGDFGYAIAIDASGNAYVTGSNEFSLTSVTAGAFQSTPAGIDESTGFVTKSDPSGASPCSMLEGLTAPRRMVQLAKPLPWIQAATPT